MADTSAQADVARWVCDHFLPERYAASFSRQRVPLTCGGDHSFAAASEDGKIVGTICTASASRSSGGLAVGRLNKVRADLYFLVLADCERRFIAVTQPIMFELLRIEQQQYHRIPGHVELIHVTLPSDLRERLLKAQEEASQEVAHA